MLALSQAHRSCHLHSMYLHFLLSIIVYTAVHICALQSLASIPRMLQPDLLIHFIRSSSLHDASTMLCIHTVAERDTAIKQNESTARELSQLRESSAVLQQQLHVMTLEKQSEAEKSAKVGCTCVDMTCEWSTSQWLTT